MMAWTGGFRQLHQFAVTAAFLKADEEQTHALVDYAMRLAFYAGLTAIFLMITALVVKLMWNCEDRSGGGGGRADESSRLLPSSPSREKDAFISTYGTNGQDLESGSRWSSSEEELHDGKICVICYDDPRECFFIPCGHCIACHTCATRIMKEESKSCPICRGIIDKIRKLQIS